MSLFSSSTKSTTSGTATPTNPVPVTNSIIDFTKLITALGGQDPSQYVTGPSNLQNAAFGIGAGIASRYGAGASPGAYSVMGPAQVNGGPRTFGADGMAKATINGGPGNYGADGGVKPLVSDPAKGAVQHSGLWDRYGVAQTPDANLGQLSSGNYTPDPELEAGWQQVASRPQDQAFIRRSGGDYNNDGRISREEYINWHRDTFNDRGSYQPEVLNPQQPGSGAPTGATGGGGGVPLAQPGIGYSPAQMGNNPVAQYGQAADITRAVAGAGANFAQMSGLGPANFYNASGPAGTQGYTASGPAGTSGYSASGPANVGGYDPAQIMERVEIDPVTNARATQGYKFADPYNNGYTNDVVNTTLANFDEYAGRQRAQEAAQAAGNNAFGGSRFAVQRAITEEQIARERASQEANLRFSAQDRAYGLGMQDASSANAASLANAQAANARAQAQAGMDFSRLMANMDASNTARMFGANASNTAALDFAGRSDAASAFGADAANRSALDFAGRSDAAGAFGADAANRAALDYAGRADSAGQFNAGSQNQFDLTRFGAANDMARFNAGQADTALARSLAAGGQLGDLAGQMGANERADLAALAALGEQERGINQQQATADLELMRLMAALYGTMPYGLFNGQNSTQTTNATTNPSILGVLGAGAMGLGSLGWDPLGRD